MKRIILFHLAMLISTIGKLYAQDIITYSAPTAAPSSTNFVVMVNGKSIPIYILL